MRNNEVPLSQCDKCGSVVPPDHINWDKQFTSADCFKVFILGMIVGGFLHQLFLWI